MKTASKLYKIKSIAAISGFTPTLLRAWERRYGILSPVRTPTGHRLYTQRDVDLVLRLRELIDQGHSIGELVPLGPEVLLSQSFSPPKGGPRRAPSLPESRAAVLQAAEDLDESGLATLLDSALAHHTMEALIPGLFVPCLREVGERWARGQATVAAEHLLHGSIRRRLPAPVQTGPHPVLIASLPEEQHDFGCAVVAFMLHQGGIPAVNFGQSLPFEDLDAAIAELKPRCVLLSVAREELLGAYERRLAELARRWQGKTCFWLGGAGVGEPRAALKAPNLTLWRGDCDREQIHDALRPLHWGSSPPVAC